MKVLVVSDKLKAVIDVQQDFHDRYRKAVEEFVQAEFKIKATHTVIPLKTLMFRCTEQCWNVAAQFDKALRTEEFRGQTYLVLRKNTREGKRLGKAWQEKYDALGKNPGNWQNILLEYIGSGQYGWRLDKVQGKLCIVELAGVSDDKRQKMIKDWELTEMDV